MPTQFGIPLLGQTGIQTDIIWARQEYGSILVTADASLPTRFRFPVPVLVSSGTQYAIVVQYDGDEDFLIWTNKTGDLLVGTNTPSPGPGGNFVGSLFTYISPTGAQTGTGIGYSNNQTTANSIVVPNVSTQLSSSIQLSQQFLLSTWSPLNSTDLKFQVSVSRYFTGGIPVFSNTIITSNTACPIYGTSPNNVTVVSNGVLQVSALSTPVEFIQYDKTVSNTSPISFGDFVYQDQPYWSGGKPAPATIAVTNNDLHIIGNGSFSLANGSAFSWTQLYANSAEIPQYIVVTSLNHDGSGLHRVNVRRVIGMSGANLAVTEPLTFTNAAANFFPAPVGKLGSALRLYGAGGPGAPIGKSADILVLTDTSANSTCRFVNNCITSYSIGAGGTGYSNNDILNVTGFENVGAEVSGGYKAIANVITNVSGVITSLNFSNNGCGFVNTAQTSVSISNNSGGTSNGSGATITVTIDTTLKTEPSGGQTYFKGAKVVNFDALQIVPLLTINNPGGTTQQIINQSLYHSNTTANTYSGVRYFVDDDPTISSFTVQNGAVHNYSPNTVPSIVSRSNQYAIRYANGAVANDSIVGKPLSNDAKYIFNVASNNDFSSISFGTDVFTSVYARYIINNDYTKEETNYGNAWAKHVTTKVNLADGMEAEDLLVYLTAYRPPGTDFKVYARIYNSVDGDTFDSKDWTLLEQTDGLNVYSSPNNPTDMNEYTYNFTASPNTDYTSVGTITTTLNSNSLIGSNTNFTSNLAANDLVKIYQPLFPNNYMVGVVGSIVSNVSITLTSPITNNGIVGTGLKLDRLAFPHQAFNDILNSNVVAYYNSSMARVDAFDTMALKIIFLSNNNNLIPKIDDCRSIAVTS